MAHRPGDALQQLVGGTGKPTSQPACSCTNVCDSGSGEALDQECEYATVQTTWTIGGYYTRANAYGTCRDLCSAACL